MTRGTIQPRKPETIRRRILQLLTAADEPMTTTEIRKKFRGDETQRMKSILTSMVQTGAVSMFEYQPTTGRGGFKYELAGRP